MFSGITPLNINMAGSVPVSNGYGFSNLEPVDDLYPADNLYAYVEHVFSHYEDVLVNTSSIWDWFKARNVNLTHSMISEFRLGFADHSLCKNYGRNKGRQSDLVRGTWQRLGILKPSGYQFFHGDVVFPFFDNDAQIVGAYGRRVTSENRSSSIYHHHWFHGKPTFFNLQALDQYDKLILCKSPLEALVLLSAGLQNVISTMGLFSFGHTHLKELEKHSPKEIVLAFDNTDSGNHISGLVAQAVSAAGIKCSRLKLPRNQDVGKLAQSEDDFTEVIHGLVDTALPFGQSYECILGGV